MKTVKVILQIEPTLKAAGDKAAAAEHRSLSGLIEKLLTDYCETQAFPEASSSPLSARLGH
jgi:hypothetical protein